MQNEINSTNDVKIIVNDVKCVMYEACSVEEKLSNPDGEYVDVYISPMKTDLSDEDGKITMYYAGPGRFVEESEYLNCLVPYDKDGNIIAIYNHDEEMIGRVNVTNREISDYLKSLGIHAAPIDCYGVISHPDNLFDHMAVRFTKKQYKKFLNTVDRWDFK